jgi:hypothetical protein
MKNIFLFFFLGGMIWIQASGQFQERISFNAKFEPESQIIHGAGQSDEFAFAGYTEVMGPTRHPMPYMEYTGANDTPEELKEEIDKHPFLIVNEDMYADLREKANHSPWKEMKEDAQRIFAQEYDSTFEDVDDKAIRIRDIISAGTLLWILEPDSQEIYQDKIVSTLYRFNDVMDSRGDPPKYWDSNVPLACAAFNAFITLDVLYNYIPVADRDSIESLYFNFLENQRSTAWKESYYSSLGIYYLYMDDSENFNKFKSKYRRELELHLTGSGIFTGGTGYSTSRFLKDEREQKFMFMDVLEFTGEDNYYDDPLFQDFHEWLFAHNFNTYGSIYIFGDAKLGTSIRTRLEQSPGTWRVNRFSPLAAQYAAWHVQGKTPEGRLLCYLAVDSLTTPARPDFSKIYPDGGAWFVHNPSNEEHVSGVLWNPESYTDHAHKEVNAIHLSAYGEDLVVNSGYSNWGNGALGFSWNYIHDRAKSSNTVLIDNQDHKSKTGHGINNGFIIDNTLGFATGEAGPALSNGEHQRTLQMIYPGDETPGYWVLFDEVKAFDPSKETQVLLHPRSADVTTLTENQFYTWNVKRWSEHGAEVSIFLATPPKKVELIDGVQADKSNSILTKVLKSTYETDETGNKNILTLTFPSDTMHKMPEIKPVTGNDYSGAEIEMNERITDFHIQSVPGVNAPAKVGEFNGKYLFQRTVHDSVQFISGIDITSYMQGDGVYKKGFFCENPVQIFLENKSGKIQSDYGDITFYYPGIEQVLLNGEVVTPVDDGINSIKVTVPSGTFDFDFSATGIPEEDTLINSAYYNEETFNITLFPNPVNDFVYIRGFPEKIKNLRIEIYNIQGQKVMDVIDIEREGLGDIRLGNASLPEGSYITRILFTHDGKSLSFYKKMLIK